MTSRRPLIEPSKSLAPSAAADVERAFVFQEKTAFGTKPAPVITQNVSRVPITSRVRSDLAAALKRASLERQLEGVAPNTLQDILEDAIEPWLKNNGYLD